MANSPQQRQAHREKLKLLEGKLRKFYDTITTLFAQSRFFMEEGPPFENPVLESPVVGLSPQSIIPLITSGHSSENKVVIEDRLEKRYLEGWDQGDPDLNSIEFIDLVDLMKSQELKEATIRTADSLQLEILHYCLKLRDTSLKLALGEDSSSWILHTVNLITKILQNARNGANGSNLSRLKELLNQIEVLGMANQFTFETRPLKSEIKRGRPPQCDQDKDELLFNDWHCGKYRSRTDCAKANKIRMKDFAKALKRHAAKLKRKKN